MDTKQDHGQAAGVDRPGNRLRALARRLVLGAAAFAVVPFAVEVEPVDRDTSFTTFTFGAGTGSYADVSRGCNGVISSTSRPVSDVGLGVEHRMGPAAVGLRASQVRQGEGGYAWPVLLNPHVAYEGGSVGVGAGVMFPVDDDQSRYESELVVVPFSGHLRLGSGDAGTDFSISFGENVPLSTPAGGMEMSQGLRISRRVGARIGVAGTGPFDSVGLLVRTKVDATDAFAIELRGRIGASEGESESTIGVALSYRVRHD